MDNSLRKKITYFSKEKIEGIELPEKFTFPFYYEPHPLTRIAITELQDYLENEFSSEHNFGLDDSKDGLVIGKMFGVLVVRDQEQKIGYLSAFSGKLAGTNEHEKFVPPVFDMLAENSFFLRQEEILNEINRKIEQIESDPVFLKLRSERDILTKNSSEEISAFRKKMKLNKETRRVTREKQKQILSPQEYSELETDLIKQSYRDQHELKVLTQNWKERILKINCEVEKFELLIESLKKERREKSSLLQEQLFEQYSFLNKFGKAKSLSEIFKETIYEKPPAAAGECSTPKLLQFAFQHDLTPLAFAEFWWGTSPKSEIRKHKHVYPACNGKCRPILRHMLQGINLEDNPLLKNLAQEKELKIIYEDDHLVIVNKPSELLSVPGIEIHDSVYSRLQDMLDSEPLIVHRLDMSTSGLMVVAKTKEAHKNIQQQFLKRTVQKRYSALLSRRIEENEGEINLPLRGDFDDRPRQLVCFEHGKKAVTKWKAVNRYDQTTKVYFWPLTGRTHQLRMHAAHELGLNAPIVGDDLYGTASNRLHLHASLLEFQHPATKEQVRFEVNEDF